MSARSTATARPCVSSAGPRLSAALTPFMAPRHARSRGSDGTVEKRHMSLTVLNVAYPLAPVGQDAVGGAEQVVTALDRALLRAGHRSLVIGCEGSSIGGT